MAAAPWQAVINNIRYLVQDDGVLDDAVVSRVAAQLIDRPVAGGTVAENADAVAAAARSPEPLPQVVPLEHTEAEVRDFLARLDARLEQLRPWPAPPFRPVPTERAGNIAAMRSVATITRHQLTVQNTLGALFAPAAVGAVERPVAALELATGEIVCLVGPPDFREPRVSLRCASSRPAADLVADFARLTGLSPDDLELAS